MSYLSPMALKRMVIGTHSGTFHCDEALALWMLKQLDQFKNAKIVRSRKKDVLETCDLLVDVGAEFDPDNGRFDHHQSGFFQTFSENHKTKLSSAGLIYKYYGKDVLRAVLKSFDKKKDKEEKEKEWTDEEIERLHSKIYEEFIEEIDAIDNGVDQFEVTVPPRYKMSSHLAGRISRKNWLWNETPTDAQKMKRFKEAMAVTGEELTSFVEKFALGWLPARQIVEKALKDRFSVHPSGRIMELPCYCPWKEHHFEIEETVGIEPKLLYVLYPDTYSSGTRVQTVPINPSSFINRKSLPKEWGGLDRDSLIKITGIEGMVFVHPNLFTGGNDTRDGALEMAIKALENEKEIDRTKETTA